MTQTPRHKYLARWEALKQERSSWVPHWQEISRFLLPRSGRFFVTDRNRGTKRYNSILDSSPTRALNILSAGLMGGLTSPARPWFRLGTSDPDLMEAQAVKVWLSDCTNLMLRIFQRSNTYRALHSVYEELGAFGTAACLVVPDYENVIHHFPLTAGEYCLATDWRGNVTTLYREFQKTVGEIVKEFGVDKVSPKVRNLYDRGELDAWITLVHAIEPRTDRSARSPQNSDMPWASVYFEQDGNPDNYLRESGFPSFPGMCPRWGVSGGDIYGSSPGMVALGDVKQLFHEQQRKAQCIDYGTSPPLQVPTSMKNRDVDFKPGGINYVDTASPGGGIRSAWEVRLDLPSLLEDIHDVRGRINSAFFADLFLMLSGATDSRMTATEVAERHEEKMLMLGPVLERLQNELLDPLIELTFGQIMAAGLLPPPPPELQGHKLQVELISMLAQAQRAIGTNSVDRFVGNMGAVAQFKPEVLDKFDADKWADHYADSLGIDPSIILSGEQVQAVRQARAQAQQAAQQAALANQGADTAKKLADTPTSSGGSNALSDITRQFAGYT